MIGSRVSKFPVGGGGDLYLYVRHLLGDVLLRRY